MPETDAVEFDLLRRRADAANCFVQRHRDYDPARGGGDLYLQPKRKFRSEHVESILRFATADEIHRKLGEIERGER